MKKAFLLFVAIPVLALTSCGTAPADTYEVNKDTWNELINQGGAINPFTSNVSMTLENGGVPFLGIQSPIDVKINNGTVFIDWKHYSKFYLTFDQSTYNERTGKYESYEMIQYSIDDDKYTKGQAIGGKLIEVVNGWILPGMALGALNYEVFKYSEENKRYEFTSIITTKQLPPLPTNDIMLKFHNTFISFLNNKVQSIEYTVLSWETTFTLNFYDYGTTSFVIPVVE